MRVVKELGVLRSNDSGALEGVPVLRVKGTQIEATLAWKDFSSKWHLPLNSQIVLRA